jgi:hypothetical protein
MAKLTISSTRSLLQEFNFHKLFIEELGWSQPSSHEHLKISAHGIDAAGRQIAELGGVAVFEIAVAGGTIPGPDERKKIHAEVKKSYHENLLIFINKERTESLWYWVKREDGKPFPRYHYYSQGQPGDLFLSKLSSLVIDLADFSESGDIHVTEVVNRLKKALDVEPVIKRFYQQYSEQRIAFTELITGIKDDHDRKWYASIILNRLMFVYFLQGKLFLDGGKARYLQEKLAESKEQGTNRFFSVFLQALFFEGFAKPEADRSASAKKLLGEIKYLNGGLFLPHRIEIENTAIDIPDKAFENLLKLFESFSWNLNDAPGGQDDDMNPDVLGYIFEKYINQKAFGAYYTRPEITEYLCERTIHKLILDRVNNDGVPGSIEPTHFERVPDLLMNLDADLCKLLLTEVLPNLSLLDPACGSGAFLVAAMKTLIEIYSAIIGKIEFGGDRNLKEWLRKTRKDHQSINYFIKKRIITDNLYGVDIMEEATEIARLRLFLALVASAGSVEELEPLPNIDFNIMPGNSLVGLLHVEKKTFDESGDLITQSYYHTYSERLAEKNRLIDTYRHAATYAQDLRALKSEIEKKNREVCATLDSLMLDQFGKLGIKYEQATWDEKKNKEGKSVKRALTINDIKRLKPFHWGYEFDEIINKKGGFDAIITNPPWEIFKPNGKEFLEKYSGLISKKKMSIKEFEKEQAKLLKDDDIRKAWLAYQSDYPYVSEYYRTAEQYKNQISIVNGKKAGTDINLYKLFVEQCFNLLRKNGECGIVIPSGIYTDLGTKQLREMLFGQTEVTGLFCFENRKEIFENVDSRFKFVVLSYKKGGRTISFPTQFMRHDVEELEQFPQGKKIEISVELVRKLSPDSLSVMEFKSEKDIIIAKKMLKWPLLGEKIEGKWNVTFTAEFHMTNDSYLFKTEPGKGRLPLYEGKMIWHFDHKLAAPRYWVDEKPSRKAVLGRENDSGQKLNYQYFRLGFRDIASNTNERTMVSTIIPPAFHGNKIPTVNILGDDGKKQISNIEQAFLCAVWDSFVIDSFLRMKVTTTLNFFYIYQLPIPRLTSSDKWFPEIVSRSARLICTTPEFDDLAREVGLGSHKQGATDPAERAKLRAELDGIIANLYELTEDEFKHILSTFPLVKQDVKDAALEQYRAFAPKSGDEEFAAIIKAGEKHTVEFKESARWDMKQNKQNAAMEEVIVASGAAFLNADGGTLLIGVKDNGSIVGLKHDYKTLGKKPDRDGFENWLTGLLLDRYKKDVAPHIAVSFHDFAGEDVCRITFKQAHRPVFVPNGAGEAFYVRTGNSKKKLSISEAMEYCRQRWPG